MAKKICPSCGRKVNENEELCPHCNYFFSSSNSFVDTEGRPYSDYQESMHQGHYTENAKIENIYFNENNYQPVDADYKKSETVFTEKKFADDVNLADSNLSDSQVVSICKTVFVKLNFAQGTKFPIVLFLMFIFVVIPIISALFEFAEIFLVFGIFIFIFCWIISVNKTKSSNSFYVNYYLDAKNWSMLLEYVDKFGYEKGNEGLLYVGAIVAYYKTNNEKLAKTYLTKAVQLSSFKANIVKDDLDYLFKKFNLTEQII